jgi:hypothetical protein
MSTQNSSTLETQVYNELKNDLIYRDLNSTLEILDRESNEKIVIPYISTVSKYMDFLKSIILEVELTDIQYERYRQNPHAVSEALYGTTQYWDILLKLNNCVSRFEFNKKKIKYYDPLELVTYLNELVIKEDELANTSSY